MLFDLTAISGQRVAQVDELHLGGRSWVSSTTLFIAAGGGVVGAAAALLVRAIAMPGSMIPYLLVPVAGTAAVALFGRRRSLEGEAVQTRASRLRARTQRMDGEFIRPGSVTPFDPNGYEVYMFHDHPIDR